MDNFRWTQFFPIGRHCEYKVDDCSLNKCRNSADCVPDGSPNSYKCICPEGFTGEFCETNINDCVNSKCSNNTKKCIDKTNGYHCLCEKNYFGVYCEKRKAALKNCEIKCNRERGHCQSDNVCTCAESFEGESCDRRKNYCFVEACFNNGSCVSNSSGFTCNCNQGNPPDCKDLYKVNTIFFPRFFEFKKSWVFFLPLHKKWSFSLRISSVNVTKSAVFCGFGHIYLRNS